MDLTETTIPKSDQMNADDLDSGPRTFTIKEVRRASSAEQPVDIVLVEFPAGRPFKPSKSMRRVMMAAWGKETDVYPGRRFTLYRDPDIKFGADTVGGIRISHMSHLPGNKRLVMPLTVTRGKREPYRVEPLPDDAPVSPVVSDETLRALVQTLELKGIPEDKWLPGVNQITGGNATDLAVITEAEACKALESLASRPDAEAATP